MSAPRRRAPSRIEGVRGSAGWRAAFASLLATAMATSMFASPAISVLSRFLMDDLALSRTQIGALAAAFALTDAPSGPWMGRLADRFGGRRMLVAVFALSAAGLLAMSAVPTYPLLLVAAMVAGLAAGGANPATNKLIVRHVPPGRRGLITGVKQSGVQAGVFLGGLLLPVGALAFGWRGALAISATVPLVGLVAALPLLPAGMQGEPGERLVDGPRRLSDPIRWLAVTAFLMGLGHSSLTTYLPLYAQEGVGLTVTIAGAVVGTSGFIGLAARILWSHFAERARHLSAPLAWIAVLAVGSIGLVWSASPGTAGLLWAGAVLAGASISSWMAVGMLAVMATADRREAGRASGVVAFGYAGGFLFGPPAFGYSVDATGAYHAGFGALVALFLLALVPMVRWGGADRMREVRGEHTTSSRMESGRGAVSTAGESDRLGGPP